MKARADIGRQLARMDARLTARLGRAFSGLGSLFGAPARKPRRQVRKAAPAPKAKRRRARHEVALEPAAPPAPQADPEIAARAPEPIPPVVASAQGAAAPEVPPPAPVGDREIAPAPPPRAPRRCTICGELGHRADNARHRGEASVQSAAPSESPPAAPPALERPLAQIAPPDPVAPAAAAAPLDVVAAAPARAPAAPRPRQECVRRCGICGEEGHRADGPFHQGGIGAADRAPAGAAQPDGPAPRRSFLPALPPALAAPADPDEEAAARDAPAEIGDDGGHGGDVADAPAAPAAFLRWTPEPAGDDDEQVPAVAALASGRWPGCRASIPADRPLRSEIRSGALTVLSDTEADAILPRPRTRGDCANVPRPCPFVSCSHHLYLDVNEGTGTLKLNHPGKEPWELTETCSLDVADQAGATLEAVGELVGLTRERIRQMEVRALEQLRRHSAGLTPVGDSRAA